MQTLLHFVFLIIISFDVLLLSYCNLHEIIYYQSKIQDNVIKNESYRTNLRPDDSMKINISFKINVLNDFDEIRGNLHSVGVLYLYWVDTRLSWNITDYGDVKYLSCLLRDIWRPEIALINAADRFHLMDRQIDKTTVWVEYRGQIFYALGDVFETTCDPVASHFPFDEHECYIQFVLFDGIFFDCEDCNAEFGLSSPLLKTQDEDGKWEYVNLKPCTRPVGNSIVNSAVFPVRLKRRPLFIVINIVIPILLMGHLNVFVFLIPVEAGERITFAITMLLSYTVFLTLVSSKIPETSNPLPRICLFLIFKLIFSAGTVICAVLVTRIAHRDNNILMPESVKKLTLKLEKVKAVMCLENTQDGSFDNFDQQESFRSEEEDRIDESGKSPELSNTISWLRVSKAMDRVFFCIYLIVVVIETISFFFILMRNVGAQDNNDVSNICREG